MHTHFNYIRLFSNIIKSIFRSLFIYFSVQFSSVTQWCPTLWNPMNCSMPGLPIHHQLPGFTLSHVHSVGDAIHPPHSAIPFSSHLQSFPASGSFPMSQFFAWGGQSTGVSASASVLPMNTQNWFPLGGTGWISLQSKGLSRVFFNSSSIFQSSSILRHSAFFIVQLSHPYRTTGKTIALTTLVFFWQRNVSAF